MALHKTSDDVSPEFHQLISYAQFKTTKAVLAAQGFKGNILSYRMRRARTNAFNMLILHGKIDGAVLRHCTECSDAEDQILGYCRITIVK